MAKKDVKTKQMAGEVTDLAKDTANAAGTQSQEAVERVEDAARDLAVRAAIREVPYAAIGLGDVVVQTARDVEASSLSQRLLQTPVAVVSKVSNLGRNPKVTYLVLAARGHGVRLQATGEQATGEAQEHTQAAMEQAQGAATATRDGAEEVAQRTGAAAEATGGRAKALLGRAKGVATRRPRTDETQEEDDASPEPAEEEPEGTADAGEAAEPTSATEATGGRAKALLGRAKGVATRRPRTDETQEQDDASAEPAEEEPESTADVGTGSLESRTVVQLRNRASELGIEGRTSMKKKELVQAIRDAT